MKRYPVLALAGALALGTPRAVAAQSTTRRAPGDSSAPGRAAAPVMPAAERSKLDLSLYGIANAGIDRYSASGATVGVGADLRGRQRVFSSGSRIGLRGGLDLGAHDLRAVFQIESGVFLDNGSFTGQSGGSSNSHGYLGSRATFLGLEGHFGRVLVGKQDVYWLNGSVEQIGEGYLSTSLPWITGANSGKAVVGVALQSDVISYTTPRLGKSGLVTVYYSPNSGGNPLLYPNSEAAQSGDPTSARLLAASGSWSHDKLQGIADVAYRTSTPGGVNRLPSAPSSLGIKLGAAWKQRPGTQLAVIATHSRIRSATSDLGRDYNGNTISLSAETVRGSWQLLGQAGIATKLSGCSTALAAECDNTGAVGILVGARYLLNASSSVYAFATAVSNGRNENHDYLAYGYGSATPNALAVGADPKIFGVGMRFNFDVILSKAGEGR